LQPIQLRFGFANFIYNKMRSRGGMKMIHFFLVCVVARLLLFEIFGSDTWIEFARLDFALVSVKLFL